MAICRIDKNPKTNRGTDGHLQESATQSDVQHSPSSKSVETQTVNIKSIYDNVHSKDDDDEDESTAQSNVQQTLNSNP